MNIQLPQPVLLKQKLWEGFCKERGLTVGGRSPAQPLSEVLAGNVAQVQAKLQQRIDTITVADLEELVKAEKAGKKRASLIKWLQDVAEDMAQ